jgi:hypothetical protein
MPERPTLTQRNLPQSPFDVLFAAFLRDFRVSYPSRLTIEVVHGKRPPAALQQRRSMLGQSGLTQVRYEAHVTRRTYVRYFGSWDAACRAAARLRL